MYRDIRYGNSCIRENCGEDYFIGIGIVGSLQVHYRIQSNIAAEVELKIPPKEL
jgi:hypothetical protein